MILINKSDCYQILNSWFMEGGKVNNPIIDLPIQSAPVQKNNNKTRFLKEDWLFVEKLIVTSKWL